MNGDNNFRLLKEEDEEGGHKRTGSRSYSFYSDPGVALDQVALNEASFLSSYMNLTNTIIGSGLSSSLSSSVFHCTPQVCWAYRMLSLTLVQFLG